MNTYTVAGMTSTGSESDISLSNTFTFCGKGLHYDWRAIVAAVESSDLDAELAQMGDTVTIA